MLPCFFNSQVKKAFSEKTDYNASANAEWQFDAYLYAVLKKSKKYFSAIDNVNSLCYFNIVYIVQTMW